MKKEYKIKLQNVSKLLKYVYSKDEQKNKINGKSN